MAATIEGRLQMYLVLGALACADMEQMQAFKTHGKAIAGRKEMFETPFDFDKFTKRAQLALHNAGFTDNFISLINWENFDASVWAALSILRSRLLLMDEAYDAPDCPCMNVIVEEAIRIEKTALNKLKKEPLT